MDPEGTEPVQGMKVHAIITRSKALQKLSKDPNLQETILPGITNEEKKESVQVQVPVAINNNSSMTPGPPGQPAPLSKETEQKQGAIKQEPVEISEVLQCPEYTIAHTEGAVQITGSSEKPHQTSGNQELPLEVKPQGMVARSEAPQKHSKDPNLRETILPRITYEEKKESVQVQIPVPINNNSSMIPGPPGQPAPLSKETELKQVTVKQELAEISEARQCPGYTIAHTEDAVQITRPFEKTHQTSDNQELLLEVQPQGMAAKSEAPKKHFQDLERQETELPDRTCKENAMSLQVQVRVKQEPVEHLEVLQNPECNADCAVEIPVSSEKPLQTSKHEELRQASCEKVYRQVMPRIPPQDPRRAVSSRVEIPVGESHFSKFMLSLVTHEPVPLVGLGAVVECRSFKQPTFYLCLTCAEKVSKNQICNHIMSDCHQYNYLLLQYPDLVLDWKKNPTEVAWWLQDHERVLDVQVMKLDLSMYNKVASVPCATALDVLQLSGKERSQNRTRPSVSPGLAPIIVNKWTPLPQEIPETPPQHPGKNDSPRDQWRPGESFPIEEAIPHQEAVLIAEPFQTVQTALDPEQDTNPSESVCLSDEESEVPAVPLEQSPDLKEADRLGVDSAVEMGKHGGAPQGSEPQNSGQAEATKAETEPAQASPGEPWPNLKGMAMDKVPVEKSCRTLMDLQTYMEDPHRTQPLVGVSALIECHSEKQTSFYLCMACCLVLKTHIIEHIIGPKHRSSYLMKRRPDIFREWSAPQDSAKRSSYLLEVAKEVEREELGGVKEIQKVPLDSTTYLDVKSAPFDKALNLVQTIYKKQNLGDLQIHVTPAQRPVTVKKEKVEIEESCEESIQDPQISGSGMSRGVENLTNAATTSREHQLDSWSKTPLIGLQKVIKCASVERCSPPFYLCQACSTKLTGNLQSIINHLISVQHQYFYIKSCHPKRLEKEEAAGSLTCGLTDLVQFVAKKLEQEEGCGTFQVFTMSKKVYERLKQGNYEYCMKMLNLRNDVEEGQSCKKPAARSLGQTTQRSDCPSTVHMAHPDPLVSGSLCPAELRTQKITIVKTHLESSRALAAHHPSDPSSCPSLQSCTNLHLASSYSEYVLPRTSKPRARTPGSTQDSSNSPSLSDTLSVTKLPPEKDDDPTQPAPSSLANDVKFSIGQDGVQGQQIASLMLSDRNSRHKLGDEHPWNYENRQFTSCFTLGKQSPWVCSPKDGAPNNHLPDRAPIPPGTQKPMVKGGHCSNNILISPSKTVSRQEVLPVFLDSSKLAHDQTMHFRGVQDADTNSGSECMVKEWHSKEGTNRISSSNKTHCTTCLPASDCSRSMSAEGVPQSVSILGKRRRQSSSTQCHTRNDNTRRPSSDFDPPPLKIPGLDYGDSEKIPAEKLLTCWKTVIGKEGGL
ncbi:hypothetical protein GJAV_G00096360 [Gymnothorax javanicus]|nr:hypothetical protein GJAV_G00096360 [Gymnothorax javanicus]